MPLFNRSASVIIGDPSSDNAIEISGLRFVFTIEQTKTSSQNTLKLKIYNLSDATSAKFQVKDAALTLKVGYERDVGREIIFSGSITRVAMLKDYPHTVLDIECGDGMDKLREARSNISNAENVSVTQILNQLGSDLGVVVKDITKDIKESFNNGFSFVGSTKQAIDSIAKQFGLDWSIQNGELQISKKGKSGNRVAFISQDTGMLESPELIVSDAQVLQAISNSKPKYKVRVLMDAKIRATSKVQIESIPLNSSCIVDYVKHSGDTHGKVWDTLMVVVEV